MQKFNDRASSEDVERGLAYCSKIKAFDLTGELDIKREELQHLRQFLSSTGSILFPNTRTLRTRASVHTKTEMELVLATMGTGPRFSTFRADMEVPMIIVKMLVPFAQTLRMFKLALSGRPDDGPAKEEHLIPLLDEALQAKRVALLSPAMSEKLWLALCHLPSLQELWLATAFVGPLPHAAFSSVIKLELHVSPPLTTGTALLRSGSFPNLQKLEIHFADDGEWDAMEPTLGSFFQAIESSCPRDTLTSIFTNCISFDIWRTVFRGNRFSPDVIRPLFRFTQMRRFHLDLAPFWDFDDAFIDTLARAWPRLEILLLDPGCYSEVPRPSRVTFKGLQTLAARCPRLRKLTMDVGVSQTSLAAASPVTDGPKLSSLHFLDIRQSPIHPADIDGVATFLFHTFPAVQDVRARRLSGKNVGDLESVSVYEDRWAQVSARLHAMRA